MNALTDEARANLNAAIASTPDNHPDKANLKCSLARWDGGPPARERSTYALSKLLAGGLGDGCRWPGLAKAKEEAAQEIRLEIIRRNKERQALKGDAR